MPYVCCPKSYAVTVHRTSDSQHGTAGIGQQTSVSAPRHYLRPFKLQQMNGNWAKIPLFSILFLVLGFILGRVCGNCGGGKCGPGEMRGGGCAMHGDMGGEACMHGNKGKCCSMKGDPAMDHHGMEGGKVDSTAAPK